MSTGRTSGSPLRCNNATCVELRRAGAESGESIAEANGLNHLIPAKTIFIVGSSVKGVTTRTNKILAAKHHGCVVHVKAVNKISKRADSVRRGIYSSEVARHSYHPRPRMYIDPL